MNLKLEAPLAMKHYQNAYQKRIIVIGCGGTGGYLVPHLARLIASWNDPSIDLVLMDGDIVESKNLTRQNFITPDLGKYKAEVLAERYSAAFGISIRYIPEYFKNAKMLTPLTTNHGHGANIVIGCVDNHRTRREIAKWFRRRLGRIWIDAGNEEMHGQVICGINFPPYASRQDQEQPFGLPCVADLFPEIDNDRKAMFNDELSCAERAQSAPQNIATNIMAANYLLNFTQQVLMGEPLYTHGVFFSTDRSSSDCMVNLPARLDTNQWPGYKRPRKRTSSNDTTTPLEQAA